ncbi:MAG: hypothetical protein AMJ94_15325 [Deltaproteobacteria bacterium SM23_61]|nr:MAG: hypothetical protein AMJ94_15325 [Deltaproteobacteria bacterium SM23_61]
MLLLFLGQAAVHDAFSQGRSPVDLNVYRWKNRLLMVFSPSQEDPNYQLLVKEMQDQRNGLIDRELLVFEIFEKGESRFGNTVLKKEAVDFLRRKFSAGQGSFLVILIGKDGEEKMRRQNQKVSLAEIFAVIDGMPMRQREMKERGKNQR